MTTMRTPTTEAMRAAHKLWVILDANPDQWITDMARVIDAETKLPELLEALKRATEALKHIAEIGRNSVSDSSGNYCLIGEDFEIVGKALAHTKTLGL